MKLLAFFVSLISFSISYSYTLTIGASKYNPPFETWANKDGHYYAYGYDIDLMKEICKRLNAECKFKPFDFDELFPVLEEKKVDLIIASIIVTSERKERFAFTLPYLESNAQYITNSNSSIDKLTDIHGKRVGARKGTPYGQLAKIVSKDNDIIFFNSSEDMFIDLQNNKLDMAVMDYEAAKHWWASNPGVYKLVGGKIPIGQGYAIMFNRDEIELKNKIDRIILQMEADGTFVKIYSQYF
ncbi:transporter substrate-binding domain-containing protein [Legionella fallonii]|uniref:Arginine 3rd transport system periplasmic binding protein n=1 Tax=Legionella fallonii LLAP-10 TaxID=1212491 RepID=A0A098G4V3_9GAMM|nr:transporter substrate-binding domain-containing protein [Legionella fallonii]CEG57024.1 Arginine 3rd transport system periplasmic binding protein [Legionella fallonii LLAP-10]